MMNSEIGKDRTRVFDEILRREDGWRLDRVAWRLEFLLNGYRVQGKRVLEIGCGSGTFSIYLALAGAARVVGVDPEGPGSSQGTTWKMNERIERLNLENCEFMPFPFAGGLFPKESFDLVISYNSINHLYEVTSDLRNDGAARDVYRNIFEDIHGTCAPNGLFVLSDCSRSNFFGELGRFGIPHPFRGVRSIEWEKHQYPSTWRNLLQDTGFKVVSQSWYVPAPLRRIRWVIDNPIANYFSASHFTIRAKKT